MQSAVLVGRGRARYKHKFLISDVKPGRWGDILGLCYNNMTIAFGRDFSSS